MTSEKKYQTAVFLFLALALSVRLAYVSYGPALIDQVWSDMREYVVKADMVLDGVWNPMHFFQSIGYSLVIALFKLKFFNWGKALAITQAIISFLTVFFVFKTSEASFGKKAGLIVLIILTLHIPWIIFNSLALPETIFTFLLSLMAWFGFKIVNNEKAPISAVIGWGFSFIGAFWLKGTHVFLLPLFLLGLLVLKQKRGLAPGLIIGLIAVAGACLHGVLTYNTIGKFQLSSSTGGLNFIEGKCPIKNNKDSIGYGFLSPAYYQLRLFQEKKWDAPFTNSSYFMKEGFKCIQKDPLVLLQSFEAIPFLFIGNTLWPANQMRISDQLRLYDQLFAIFLISGLAFYLTTLRRGKAQWKELAIWVLPVMSLFLCVYIFKSELRYRLPFDVWLIPLAVRGWIKGPAFAGPDVLEEIDVRADRHVCSVLTNVAWNELDVRVKEDVTSKRNTQTH